LCDDNFFHHDSPVKLCKEQISCANKIVDLESGDFENLNLALAVVYCSESSSLQLDVSEYNRCQRLL
jgi:hypothetical protein